MAIVHMLLLDAQLNGASKDFHTLSENDQAFWESAGPLQSLLEARGPK